MIRGCGYVPGEVWGEVAMELVRVVGRNEGRPLVKLPSGGVLEISNPRALTKAIGCE